MRGSTVPPASGPWTAIDFGSDWRYRSDASAPGATWADPAFDDSSCASGVPISGEAGVGYQLAPDCDLPPLMFTQDEIEALVIGMRMVESWGDSELRASARGILDKVDAVVSQEGRRQLQGTALFSLSFGRGKLATQNLEELRRAVNARRKLSFEYEDGAGARSRRQVRPLGLYFWGQSWTLAAYCELRADFRNFRTDRVSSLEVLEERFELTPPCTLEDYVRAAKSGDGGRDE